MSQETLITQIRNGDIRRMSRAITHIESEDKDSIELLNQIHSFTGNAYKIGITGPPGAGKSTLANQITKLLRKENKTVGILAIDPTSPFTGGALLGDRVRMNEIGMDDGVYIRSMATRGSLGGLSKKTIEVADILDAAKFDFIIFETVGVGQSELDIVKTADTTIVTLVPESGDAIQAMKAGLMEIADLFALNKSDRPGSESFYMSLQSMLALKTKRETFEQPEIIKTVASENKGIEDLFGKIMEHRAKLIESGNLLLKREKNFKLRIKEIVRERINREIWNTERENNLESSLKSVIQREISPYKKAFEIIDQYKNEITEEKQ
ncbi:MAG: methylmalonyl Co-A mutase-associated GTPase MeaB [Melioribacteraceae bacterium]|nr:methylmalonyl Co-A mutase-associated GTPase MeaB [Melioribacteraceae bacterium]MCF8264431.1 methylmalonyl Co-A mutase-associated GTPase MeaB [Melioribacteraceae bacterium]